MQLDPNYNASDEMQNFSEAYADQWDAGEYASLEEDIINNPGVLRDLFISIAGSFFVHKHEISAQTPYVPGKF